MGEKILKKDIIFIIFAIIGVYFITKDNEKKIYNIKSIGIILLSAITEALLVVFLKYKNISIWDYMFIIYGWTLLYSTTFSKINYETNNKQLIFFVLFIAIVGIIGYYLRYYSAKNLSSSMFSKLSYFGIIFSYIYSKIFYDKEINLNKIIGTFIIFFSIYFLR